MRSRQHTMADDGDDDLEALRNAVLASMKTRPKPIPNAEKGTESPKPRNPDPPPDYQPPPQVLNPVSAVSTFPRRNSPYHEPNNAPGSPHHKPFGGHRGRGDRGRGDRGRGGFHGPRHQGGPYNGPRNQGGFNAPPRSSNLIVLTASKPEPAEGKKGVGKPATSQASGQTPTIPLMVRPQDKWAGSGTVTEPPKPEKPKGPARFSRLDTDSDSDEEDSDAENDYLNKPSASSDSEPESEKEDTKDDSKPSINSDGGTESDSDKSRPNSPVADISKSNPSSPSPSSPQNGTDTAPKVTDIKTEASDEENSDSDDSPNKPDYHRVPPPSFSPAPSPKPTHPTGTTHPAGTTHLKVSSPDVRTKDKIDTSTSTRTSSSTRNVPTISPPKRTTPVKQDFPRREPSPPKRTVKEASLSPKRDLEETKSPDNQGDKMTKKKSPDIRGNKMPETKRSVDIKRSSKDQEETSQKKTKSPNEKTQSKAKDSSSPRGYAHSVVNGGSSGISVSKISETQSRRESLESDQGTNEDSSSLSESDSESDSSQRRDKYTSSERKVDDIERERRLRVVKEREGRVSRRRSQGSKSTSRGSKSTVFDTRRHEQNRSQYREDHRSESHRSRISHVRSRDRNYERPPASQRRPKDHHDSSRESHSSERKYTRKVTPPPPPPQRASKERYYNSESDSESESTASEKRPKIRSVTTVVKTSSLNSSSRRTVSATDEQLSYKPKVSDSEKRRSHSKDKSREKTEKSRNIRTRVEDKSSSTTRIIVQGDSKNHGKDARKLLNKTKDSHRQDRSDSEEDDGQRRNTPTINVTFNKDPPLNEAAKSRLPVHQRLGLPLKQKRQSPESRGRRVIAEDSFDTRPRKVQKDDEGMSTRRSENKHRVQANSWSTDEEEDMAVSRSPSPSPPPPPKRGIEHRLGKRRAASSSPEHEYSQRSSKSKKRSHRSIADRLGVPTEKASGDFNEQRKGNPIWSSRPSEAESSKHKKRTEREQIQVPSKSREKSSPDGEEALSARIQRIQEQNAVIRRRKQEIDRDKAKFGYK